MSSHCPRWLPLVAGLLLLLMLAVITVEGVPAGVMRLPQEEDADADVDYVDLDVDSENDTKKSGVLGRLLSGLGASLGMGLPPNNTRTEERLRRYREQTVSDLESLVKALGKTRNKPGSPLTLINHLTTHEGFYRLIGLDNDVDTTLKSFTSPNNPSSMVLFEHQQLVFWLVTETFTDTRGRIVSDTAGQLHVYMLELGSRRLQTTTVATRGAVRCEPVVKLKDFIDIVCAERTGHLNREKLENGSSIYRVKWQNGLEVHHQRALKTRSPRDFTVWTSGNDTFLAFVNAPEVGETGPFFSLVYKQETHEDYERVYSSYHHLDGASFQTLHARGLAALTIGSNIFVAVANFKDAKGNIKTTSDIFRLVKGSGTIKLFQRVKTSAARDFTSFTFSTDSVSEHFLAVANEFTLDQDNFINYRTESVIYKFAKEKFVPFQCIPTHGAKQWLVYQGGRGEFVLALVSSLSGISFYQYNGWRFVLAPFKIGQQGVESAWLGSLPNTLNQVVLTFTLRGHSRPFIYYLQFQHLDPVSYHERGLAWCRSFRGQLGAGPSQLVARIQAVPRRDQPHVFTSPVNITNLLLPPSTSVVSHIRTIIVRDAGYTVDHGFAQVSSSIEELHKGLSRLFLLRAILVNSVRLDRPNIDNFHFSSVNFQCGGSEGGTCRVGNLVTREINGQSASLDRAIFLKREQSLLDLSLAQVEVTGGSSLSVEYLSGPDFPRIKTSSLVTLSGNHTITARKDFGIVKTNRLLVSGTVNNIRVDEQTLLLTDREQTVAANLTVRVLLASNLQLHTLNGRDFSPFLGFLILNNTNQHIQGPLVVDGEVRALFVETLRPLKPLDPRQLVNRALFHTTSRTQVVTGSHSLAGLEVQDLRVTGRVNGVSVPDDLFLRNRNETVTVPVTFHSLQANSVQVLGSLGGIRVINGALDVLLVHGNQVVTGRKTFVDLVLLGHSSVSRLVSGYRLQDLQGNTVGELLQGVAIGRQVTGTVTFEGGVTVTEGVVGGVNITDILLNALPINSPFIPATFIFEDFVEVLGDVRVTDHLNGKHPSRFVLLDGSHTFTRLVTFTSDVIVNAQITVETTVNGVALRDLARQLVLVDGGAQTIVQDITIHSPSFASFLHVGGRVVLDGVDLSDLVTRSGTTDITGLKIFNTVTVTGGATAGNVVVARGGTVDGVVLDELFFKNSLRKSGGSTQHLVGRVLNVLKAASLTGTNLAAFERTVVYRDTPERLAGSLTFTGPVVIKQLTFEGSFDGVSAEEYKSGWLLKTGDQVLTGANVVQSLDVLELTFTGTTIQGVDFQRLVGSTAKVDQPTTLHRVAFGSLISSREVFVNGTVQGFKLRDEALLNGTDLAQTVTGRKTFRAPVHYRGDFSVERYVVVSRNSSDQSPASIDVGRICSTLNPPIADLTIIPQWTVNGAVTFNSNVTVLESINGEAVATLRDTFWLAHLPTTISSFLFFHKVETRQLNLDVSETVNGYNFEAVWAQALKRGCEAQTVEGQLTFDHLIVDHLDTPELSNPSDNLHLKDFTNILLRDGDQVITGNLNFTRLETREVFLEGTLNGLDVSTGLVQHGKQTVITATKTFTHLTILGNLSVVEGGTVQDVDVSELSRLAVRRDGQGVYQIPGTTTFTGLVYTGTSFQVIGNVDGVRLQRDTVLLKTGDQIMTGRLIVTPTTPSRPGLEAGTVIVLDNRFNGIDLNRLQNGTVRSDRPSHILQPVTFRGVCHFTSIVLADHNINGINLQDLAQFINVNDLIRIEDLLETALQAAKDTREALAVKGADIWYYEEVALETVSKIVAVALESSGPLVPGVYDSLVGLDIGGDAVYTYSLSQPGFPRAYRTVRVVEPVAVVGLAGGLLATCGRQSMNAVYHGAQPAEKFNVIPVESGEVSTYGHIHFLPVQDIIVAAFAVRDCRDLVSFQSSDGRVCLVVLDYAASSTVLCGSHDTGFHLLGYLDTTHALKGVWLSLGGEQYVGVVEAETTTRPANFKLYVHNSYLNRMQLVLSVHTSGVSDIAAVVVDGMAIFAATSPHTPICNGLVLVFTLDVDLEIKRVQRLKVPEVVHSSLVHLPTGEVVLLAQTTRSILIHYLKGTEFVYIREIKTAPSLHPYSSPFVYGDPTTLLIAHSGLGALHYPHDTGAHLQPVPTTLYLAVYRGPSPYLLYRGSSSSSTTTTVATPPSLVPHYVRSG